MTTANDILDGYSAELLVEHVQNLTRNMKELKSVMPKPWSEGLEKAEWPTVVERADAGIFARDKKGLSAKVKSLITATLKRKLRIDRDATNFRWI